MVAKKISFLCINEWKDIYKRMEALNIVEFFTIP